MDLFEKLYNLSLRYLQIRQRSEKEVREYLKKKQATPEVIEKIIAKLHDYNFLNDALFAKLWVESRSRAKPRSKWLLQRELSQKGIAKEIIEHTLIEESGATDLALAKQAIERRIVRFRDLPRQEVYQKVGGFLARRGFSWETSKRAIDDLLGKEYNDNE